MQHQNSRFQWHEKFCGTAFVIEIVRLKTSLNFNKMPWNFEITNFDDKSSSMKFHRNLLKIKYLLLDLLAEHYTENDLW